MPKRRGWGEGSVRYRRGAWWMRVPTGTGSQHEIRTQAKSRREAVTVLNNYVTKLRINPELAGAIKVTCADLYADMERHNKAHRKRPVKNRWAHLLPTFGPMRASVVTSQRVRDYAAARIGEGAKPATVNRELACLRRMLRLGAQNGRVMRVPTFSLLPEDNTRTGFIEQADLQRLVDELPPPFGLMAALAFWTGMRRGEILGLRWPDVDLETGELRLSSRATKTGVARSFVLPLPALAALRLWRARAEQEGQGAALVMHRKGKPVKWFYGAWRAACDRAGLSGLMLHDLRRSAARQYVRRGVSERVTRDILGHRTRSIFDRYNITSGADLIEAARKVAGDETRAVQGRAKVRVARKARASIG